MAWLRDQGHDVLVVAEIMPQADDSDILARAVTDVHAGILLLRLKDESAANRARIVKSVLEQHAADLTGNFVVVTDTHIRIRKSDSA